MKAKLFLATLSVVLTSTFLKAQFSGSFDISNWNLSSVSAFSDANIDSSGAPGQIIFNGNDSYFGDCCSLYDDLEITVPPGCTGSGQICFD